MEEPDLESEPLVQPCAMPLLLLPDIFLFPSCELPLRISEEIQSTIIKYGLEHDELFAVGCTSESGGISTVVTAAIIRSLFEFADGASEIVFFGMQRMRIVGMNQIRPFPIVRVEPIPYSPVSPEDFDEWHEPLSLLVESRSREWRDLYSEMADWVRRVEDPAMICDVVGLNLVRSRSRLRELLAEESTKRRMEILFETLTEAEPK
ncbi:MAG: LON peptidase substrate-binding domain-containing protein [Verrucomicrobiota bacterium]